MKRAIAIGASLKQQVSSFLLTRSSPYRQFRFHPSQYPPIFSSSLNTLQQISNFTSKCSPIIDLVMKNEWSDSLESQLSEKFQSKSLTHGTVVYILYQLEENPKKAFDFFNWVCDVHGFNPNSLVYNQLLLILCNKDTLNGFWGLVEKMSKEGCDIDENCYRTISGRFKDWKEKDEHTAWLQCIKIKKEESKDSTVVVVVNAVLGSDSDVDMREKLEKFKDVFSENVVLKIFHALDRYPLKALFFFEWLREHGGYTHNGVTYNAILRVLKQKESINEFWSIISEVGNAGHDLDIDIYKKISRHFWKHMMVEDLVQLYEVVMDGPYKPWNQECAYILRGIANAENPDVNLVDRVVNKHEAAGNSLSKQSYDAIYRCLANSGKFDEAEKILDTMRNAGYEPDKVTYGHVLFALGKAGRVEETTKVLNEMEASGCNPDWDRYTCLIRGEIKGGKIDHALTLYTMILEKNLEVDAEFMGHLVKGLCSAGMVGKAYTMVTELVEKVNFKPLHSTFTTLIVNLLKEGEVQKALDLLPLMKMHAYTLPRQLIGDYITKFGTMDDAEKFLATHRNAFAYLDFFRSFIKGGRQSEAFDLLRKCPLFVRTNSHILKLFKEPELWSASG